VPGGAAPDEVVLERELALEVDRCPVLTGARCRPVRIDLCGSAVTGALGARCGICSVPGALPGDRCASSRSVR
jgi:hypothetical protein